MPDETVDLSGRVEALERRVTRIEGMAEAVTAVRADMATIAQGVDPRLTEHVAELDDRVEKHALLIGRLLEVTPMARRREGDE